MTELDQALKVLGGDNGTVVQILAWMGALRVVFKLVSGKIQESLERAMTVVSSTEDTTDDAVVQKIITSPPYRVLAFVIDWATSIKLPLKLKAAEPKE